MNIRKKKKSIFIAFIIIVAIILIFFGALYYITSTVNNYSYNEKKWINDNSTTSLDVYVEPGLPVFSYNGNGVYYDYINTLKEDTHLNLNVIPEDTANIRFVNKNNYNAEDIVFYKDHFVVLGKNGNINKLDDLDNRRVGILSSDKENITYYLTEHKNINLVPYETFTDLVSSLGRASDFVIAPFGWTLFILLY